MERKQGFFSSLGDQLARTLSSPSRSPSRSSSPARTGSPVSRLLRRSKNNAGGGGNFCYVAHPELFAGKQGSLRPMVGEILTPLREGPNPDGGDNFADSKRIGSSGLTQWVKGQFSRGPPSSAAAAASARSDLRLLLGVMGAPLAPVHVSSLDPLPHLSIKDTPIETSSAQYILQQYTAASGGQKLQNSIRNAYAMGKLKMVTLEIESAAKTVKNNHRNNPSVETGGFVLWQMNPDMWYLEIAVGASKVHAGCNGRLVWRHTPWLGSHTAKGPVRPLRRALQGLDPRMTASLFADAKCVGERKISGEDCFVLKLCADPPTLKARSEGPAEIIRHTFFGYFSQKSGLLVHVEDSHLTRIQSNGCDAVYWETTISSRLADYRPVDGIMIAHSGHSIVTLFRFGEAAMSHSRTKMEEIWTIEEVAFNVPGLSVDCFIPPAELRPGTIRESYGFPHDKRSKVAAKVAVLEKEHEGSADNIIWRLQV